MTGQQGAMAASAGSAPAPADIAWYIGRDGQQYGPVSDPEFRKLFEAGQVQPTDLVWREGFAAWVPATSLRQALAPAAPPAAAPATPQASPATPTPVRHDRGAEHPAPQQRSAEPRRQPMSERTEGKSRHEASQPVRRESGLRRGGRKVGRGLAWSAILVFFVLTLGAAYFVVASDKNLLRMAGSLIPSFGESVPKTEPIGGFAASEDATDKALQRSALWQVLKKYHAPWYAERVKEAAAAVRSQKSENEIATNLMQAVVTLRRQYAGDASSAPLTRLKSVAALFTNNLVRLRAHSTQACFEFVSNGEAAPEVVKLLQSPDQTSGLQAQLAATFEGINEGRKTPRVYPQPRPEDYDVLVTALEARGWTKQDMKLFSDSQALAKAAPETVCRLVTQWFESQMAIKEPDVQMRLLVDSLRPVVAG